MTEEQKKRQEELIKNGAVHCCYAFAALVDGADVKALEKRAKELEDMKQGEKND